MTQTFSSPLCLTALNATLPIRFRRPNTAVQSMLLDPATAALEPQINVHRLRSCIGHLSIPRRWRASLTRPSRLRFAPFYIGLRRAFGDANRIIYLVPGTPTEEAHGSPASDHVVDSLAAVNPSHTQQRYIRSLAPRRALQPIALLVSVTVWGLLFCQLRPCRKLMDWLRSMAKEWKRRGLRWDVSPQNSSQRTHGQLEWG
ncbi:hypothetical protein C8F01DRAFT_1085178 [Mycena amicta]|nr:hypothetical protein C8F01DRAFT_1085178 [Mycena amicta]